MIKEPFSYSRHLEYSPVFEWKQERLNGFVFALNLPWPCRGVRQNDFTTIRGLQQQRRLPPPRPHPQEVTTHTRTHSHTDTSTRYDHTLDTSMQCTPSLTRTIVPTMIATLVLILPHPTLLTTPTLDIDNQRC